MPHFNTFDVFDLCRTTLEKHGVSYKHAVVVAKQLITNELNGYSSHGVFRVSEYVKDIMDNRINPCAEPIVIVSGQGRIVDAQNGIGIVALEKVIETIKIQLSQNNIAIVGLRNSSHVGRLAGLGRAVAESGNIVLGFCNYRGAGKRTAPPGGQVPLLSTNPMLFACPYGKNQAFILDMSTTTVSEGKVRTRWLEKRSLPSDNWLYDLLWKPTDDPTGLYENPPHSILAPLGGSIAGHKGFALSMMVEILAGILTGGEFACETPGPGGNCALFIAINPNYLGMSSNTFLEKTQRLISYIESVPVADGFPPVHIPGKNQVESEASIIEIPQNVFDMLVCLNKGLVK